MYLAFAIVLNLYRREYAAPFPFCVSVGEGDPKLPEKTIHQSINQSINQSPNILEINQAKLQLKII